MPADPGVPRRPSPKNHRVLDRRRSHCPGTPSAAHPRPTARRPIGLERLDPPVLGVRRRAAEIQPPTGIRPISRGDQDRPLERGRTEVVAVHLGDPLERQPVVGAGDHHAHPTAGVERPAHPVHEPERPVDEQRAGGARPVARPLVRRLDDDLGALEGRQGEVGNDVHLPTISAAGRHPARSRAGRRRGTALARRTGRSTRAALRLRQVYAILLAPASNRVYAGEAPELVAAELTVLLAAAGGDPGLDRADRPCRRELPGARRRAGRRGDRAELGRASAVLAAYERVGDLLRPLLVAAARTASTTTW